MLDFYLINDEQPKPDYPEQANLKYISGLNSKTFENLKDKGIIDYRFDYYSDFRWNIELVKQISRKAAKKRESDTDFEKLFEILNEALESKSGVIAYCD